MTEKLIKLRGIIPPVITPLKDRDTLDAEGLERLLEYIIAGGVHGVFILGTTGEGPCLSYRLRRELIARTCQQVGTRLPVLVAVTDTSTVETLGQARCAAEAGASAVVLAAPYYFPVSQSELIEYVRRLVPEIPLPLLLYNMPAMTKVSFEPETVRQLLDIPRIVGLKDSSRRMEYFLTVRQITRQRADWSLLVGFEHMLVDTIRAGGDGGVCAGANLFPRLFVELYEAIAAGCEQRVEEIQQDFARRRAIYTIAHGAAASIKAIKCGLALRGICDDHMAEPFLRFSTDERRRLEVILYPQRCDAGTES
jgi:4-hydroxy-tetrahydrodipicolinate synthase